MYATLSPDGTVTIPLEIRQRLNVGVGDRVDFVISNDAVQLVPERCAKPSAETVEWRGDSLSHETVGGMSFVDFLRSCPVDLTEVVGERSRDDGESRRPVFAERRVLGKTPPILDSQIAATARRHGMMLVTRNTSDMAGLGVELLNPFESKSL